MITISQGLFYLLSNTAGISAIVAARIYPIQLPLNVTLPAITYRLISARNMSSHQGKSGTAYPRFQIDCWAVNPDVATNLAAQVRICLDGYTGTVGLAPNTVKIQAALMDGGIDEYDPETQRYFVSRDYVIWHEEPVT